jgi:hypothetical protein
MPCEPRSGTVGTFLRCVMLRSSLRDQVKHYYCDADDEDRYR